MGTDMRYIRSLVQCKRLLPILHISLLIEQMITDFICQTSPDLSQHKASSRDPMHLYLFSRWRMVCFQNVTVGYDRMYQHNYVYNQLLQVDYKHQNWSWEVFTWQWRQCFHQNPSALLLLSVCSSDLTSLWRRRFTDLSVTHILLDLICPFV